jgi:hypothetical protein
MLQLLSIVIIGYIVWKIVRLARMMRDAKGDPDRRPVDFPQDHSYRNIEDADFEDITRDPDKSA